MILRYIKQKIAFRKSVIIVRIKNHQPANHRKEQQKAVDHEIILVAEMMVEIIGDLSTVDQHQGKEM